MRGCRSSYELIGLHPGKSAQPNLASTETSAPSCRTSATSVTAPDENDRQADLRLDQRSDEAVAAFESGDFLERIHSDDPDFVMPPPDTKLSLTTGEKQVLRHGLSLVALRGSLVISAAAKQSRCPGGSQFEMVPSNA